jgi:hypothetical protein
MKLERPNSALNSDRNKRRFATLHATYCVRLRQRYIPKTGLSYEERSKEIDSKNTLEQTETNWVREQLFLI